MFKSTFNKGFHITFKNGYTASCQFGATNYCENYPRHFDSDYKCKEEMGREIVYSSDCEVAIWDVMNDRITSKIIEAIGMEPTEANAQANVTPDEVSKILAYVATL